MNIINEFRDITLRVSQLRALTGKRSRHFLFSVMSHPSDRYDQVNMEEFREAYRCRVFQSKVSHLFDVNVVVEVDQVSSLLLALTHSGRGRGRGLVGGGGGAARLGGGQGAAGADRNWTDVSTCWGERGEGRERGRRGLITNKATVN